MSRAEYIMKLVGLYVLLTVGLVFACLVVASVTVFPMMSNYQECGRITLCTMKGDE